MPEGRALRPHRFRRRLTAAFVLVAAISAGGLAVLTYAVAGSYRGRTFERMAHSEVQVALALAPEELDATTFERMQVAYARGSGTDTLALTATGTLSTALTLSAADVPDELRAGPTDGPVDAHLSKDGRPYLVIAGDGPDGSRYVFFFSLEQLHESLRELRIILVSGWVLVVVLSAAAGNLVARRTLRPVRDAAEAATAIAGGLLDTRLPAVGDDEFRAWTDSFNDMADALEAKVDELRRAAERQRQLTSDIAHDLRTPLTGMTATAELLATQLDDLPPASRRAATVIVRDVRRLRELVLDLLELSRLDASADAVDLERFDLRTALDVVVRSMPDHEGVTTTIADMDATVVVADRRRFRRIVTNLLTNASAHGGRHITITATPEGDDVLIRVHDDGPGIDEAQAERIFDRFYKSDTSRAHGGSGLGLAIARDHARALDGDVALDTATEEGAAFVVRLPTATPEPDGGGRSAG